jgi:hypothetical protein
MKTPSFIPKEILFCPTTECNLRCSHCDTKQGSRKLPQKTALKFISRAAAAGIKRVGFTGGEPFLASDFLCAITQEVVCKGMFFSRIMTNAAWFRMQKELLATLSRLFLAGYDGDLCVSVDAFHCQDLRKVAAFIKAAAEIWRRPDIVSIASVKGVKEGQTRRRLKSLARLLKAHLSHTPGQPAYIKNNNIFLKILYIDLSAVGKARHLKNGWDGKWFRDDFCKGPGNVFYVLADGSVKPCCGYAAESGLLTLGSIKRDTPEKLLQNADKNRFVATIFKSGFHSLRQRLEASGVCFPGKTTNHCFFCYYLTHHLPRRLLLKYL